MTVVMRGRRGKTKEFIEENTYFNKYRTLWRILNSGKEYVVCTLYEVQDLTTIFGTYTKVFKPFIDKGQLIMKTIEELGDDEPYMEF